MQLFERGCNFLYEDMVSHDEPFLLRQRNIKVSYSGRLQEAPRFLPELCAKINNKCNI